MQTCTILTILCLRGYQDTLKEKVNFYGGTNPNNFMQPAESGILGMKVHD